MGVFNQHQGPSNDVKRNAFDLSFDNHLTFNFGDLIPCFVKEVIPGDTWEIDSTVGLNFAPTAFPIQSRIEGALHFFYVRSRTLWKDFYDWYFGTKPDLVRPYFGSSSFQFDPRPQIADSFKSLGMKSPVGTSGLNDYMGFPTTFVSSEDIKVSLYPYSYVFEDNLPSSPLEQSDARLLNFQLTSRSSYGVYPLWPSALNGSTSGALKPTSIISSLDYSFIDTPTTQLPLAINGTLNASPNSCSWVENKYYFQYSGSISAGLGKIRCFGSLDQSTIVSNSCGAAYYPLSLVISPSDFEKIGSTDILECKLPNVIPGASVSSVSYFFSVATKVTDPSIPAIFGDSTQLKQCVISNGRFQIPFADIQSAFDTFEFSESTVIVLCLGIRVLYPAPMASETSVLDRVINFDDVDLVFSVYGQGSVLDVSSGIFGYSEPLQVIAEPFRAYEMIYNSFYRDSRNNPYVLNNEVQYNKYIPTDEGGQDLQFYGMRRRNWENDFLTTSQPTPQFGNAPLVGITSSGSMSFVASEDGKTYNIDAVVGEDGSSVESVSYRENIPESVRRSLVDVVTSGISINDFRNVNAYQRFLETSMRRGLKAIDQLKAHFDVNASYNALDMPEFIGGQRIVVSSMKVNQTTNSDGDPLGSYAGQLSTLSSQKHKVRCYCDEPGFIIGIICIYPRPIYSQLVDKMWYKKTNLDCYFPEFNSIGYQPILNREVAPIQVISSGAPFSDNLKTFGYQRPWYEYLSSVDVCHGLFRTQLRDFTIQRIYGGIPKLGRDFTVIDNNSLNNIFTVDGVEDKIWGRISFDVKAVRPIPKFGIPKLEPNV